MSVDCTSLSGKRIALTGKEARSKQQRCRCDHGRFGSGACFVVWGPVFSKDDRSGKVSDGHQQLPYNSTPSPSANRIACHFIMLNF